MKGPWLLWRPHPAFGHPLPEGEGLGLGRYEATLSQRERGWMPGLLSGYAFRQRNYREFPGRSD